MIHRVGELTVSKNVVEDLEFKASHVSMDSIYQKLVSERVRKREN